MRIKYACLWDKEKEKTWSGTTYSLYKNLSKYNDIEDDGIYLNNLKKNYFKLRNVKFHNGKIKVKNLYNKHEKNFFQKKINNLKKTEEKEYLLEIFDLGISNNIPYYIYQDLSIDYLIDCKNNNKDFFKYSGFQNYTDDDLEKRRIQQLEIYDKASGIFTMSRFLEKHLVEYTKIPKEKVHYIGAGYNLSKDLIVNQEKDNNKILFVGRDFYRKGGDIVCKAFKILKESYKKDAQLYIAGASKKIAINYKDCKDIYFLGDLNQNELSYYFNKCDIFCMPSYFEAYGIVFIEALIYGLPCIGRNAFAMKEFIEEGKNGYLLNGNNIEELAIKMYKLLDETSIKDYVKNNREKYIKEYSWDKVCERIIDNINDLK